VKLILTPSAFVPGVFLIGTNESAEIADRTLARRMKMDFQSLECHDCGEELMGVILRRDPGRTPDLVLCLKCKAKEDAEIDAARRDDSLSWVMNR
jgi:hypothetical protein